MTLNAWKVRHWATLVGGVRPATEAAYERGWRLRVQPWLRHRKLESIGVTDVDDAITGWTGTASTRNDALAVLSRLLEGAARAGIMLDFVDSEPHRGYLAALVYTGMRAGEASALRVSDVDLAHGVINVRRSFSPAGSGRVREQTPHEHPLLWVSDAVAWCYSNSGDWVRRVDAIVESRVTRL